MNKLITPILCKPAAAFRIKRCRSDTVHCSAWPMGICHQRRLHCGISWFSLLLYIFICF